MKPSVIFRKNLLASLEVYGIQLKPEIGQHLLVNEVVISQLVEAIPQYASVIEIGAGPGQITQKLAQRHSPVTAVEIDRQFRPHLEELRSQYANLILIFGDVLRIKLDELIKGQGEVWLAGNLPHHITEPLFMQIASLPIEGAVFLIGARFGREIQAISPGSSGFGKLTLLVNTFFSPEILQKVPKKDFYPASRTDSIIVRLARRDEEEYLRHKTRYILRELFLTARRSTLTKNALMNALIKFEQGRRSQKMTKNDARREISSLNLPELLLNKPVEQLNNAELEKLYGALGRRFGDIL